MTLTEQLHNAIQLNMDMSFDGDLDVAKPYVQSTRRASVLIMVNQFETTTITLTQRPQHLRGHAGQVAFPGGGVESDDPDSWATARREAWEEIGLPLSHPLEHIGMLSTHHTISGYEVTPHLAINNQKFDIQPDPVEVDTVFEIDFDRLNTQAFEIGHAVYAGKNRHFYVLPHPDYYIWGATARMLYQLAERIENVGG